MEQIEQELANHDYISKLRAELKVLSYKTAKSMVEKSLLPSTDKIKPVELNNKDDELILAMCIDLFKSCGLTNTVEMINLENSKGLPKDGISKFKKSDQPCLLQFIK